MYRSGEDRLNVGATVEVQVVAATEAAMTICRCVSVDPKCLAREIEKLSWRGMMLLRDVATVLERLGEECR